MKSMIKIKRKQGEADLYSAVQRAINRLVVEMHTSLETSSVVEIVLCNSLFNRQRALELSCGS